MPNTTTLNLRVNPIVKKQAEEILSELGIPMSTAINMYLRQINLTGGIPFSVELPKAPDEINAELMTDLELHDKLQKGYDDVEAGKVSNASETFKLLKEKHSI
ncbi:type II toxin-antitoxin system RelB/DinJ family antitoxin [Petrocella sp. FN5]|uniref:type II toxin-antitoxin system RelB/DinJ family antitoxin n=1 Tax=Petrocella sp. FN5 TaxID=3032002 RepID=UPI0023DCB2A5|nr:type II toxin-antitoxin system RelB/DinJ family antitoxin [Petrocella sp. FN5]MDF1618870.1 type II toxin-antitoxin system RelB/DinJ family antitoxin [Petrocella sp. FN5]